MYLKKYITNVSALQFLQLARFATVLAVSVIMAKSFMPVADIGHYERLLFYGSAFTFFWATGLIQSFLPLFGNNKSFGDATIIKNPAFFNAAFLLSVFSVFAALIIIGFGITNRPDSDFFFWLAAYIALSAPVLLIEYIYLLQDKPVAILNYAITSLFIQLLAISIPVILKKPVEYCFAGMLFSLLFRWVWLIILLKKVSRFVISGSFIKEHLQLGYPLVISALLSGSAQYIDGILVNLFYDSSTFAIFRYGARELPLSVLLANALDNSMTPEFNRNNLIHTLDAIKRKSKKLMHIVFPVSIILIITSRWLYPVVFNDQFLPSSAVFNIYLLLAISRMVFPQTILVGHKLTRYIMMASVTEIVLHISACLIFIRLWGITGVAFSTLFSYIAEKTVLASFVYKKLEIKPPAYIPLKTLIFYSVLLAAAYGFTVI